MEAEVVPDRQPPEELHESLASDFGDPIEEHDLDARFPRVVQRLQVDRPYLEKEGTRVSRALLTGHLSWA